MTSLQPALVLFRFAHFASCMFVFGASAFSLALRDMSGSLAQQRQIWIALKSCAVVAIFSAVLWLACVAGAMAGEWHGAIDLGTIRSVLFTTEFGRIWAWRIVISLLVAIVAFWELPQRRLLLIVLAGVLLASVALTGHAAMDPGNRGILHRAADALHLLSGGYWIGALAMLPLLLPGTDAETNFRILQRFSDFGIAAVLFVLLSGVANALFIVHDWPHLLAYTYGTVLLTKVALVAAMVSIACLNRWALMPRLREGGDAGLLRLRISVHVEILIGGLILLAASLLGTVAPPLSTM